MKSAPDELSLIEETEAPNPIVSTASTSLAEGIDSNAVGEWGVPRSTVIRGVLKRFLPAHAGILSGLGLLSGLIGGGGLLSLLQFGLLAGMAGGVTLGFGLGLEGLRRWLDPASKVDGRRSVVAGLVSPLYLGVVSIFRQGSSLPEIGLYCLLTGLLIALTLYFPWLSKPSVSEDEVLEIPAEVD